MVKGKRVLVAVLLALLTLLFTLPSQASAETLAQKKARARDILQQLSVLDKQLEVVIERYDAANAQLQTVQAQIAQNRQNLKIAKYNLSVAKSNLQLRVVALYKQRPVDMLDVMLATRSFDDFMTQLDLFNRVGQSDAGVVTSITGYEATVTATQTKLAADQKTAVKLVAQRSAEKQTVEAKLATRKSMYAGVRQQIQQLEAQQQATVNRQAQSAGVVTVGGTAPPGSPQVLQYAFSKKGAPYVYGAAGPDSFDCSGFTMWCYAQIGIGLDHNAELQRLHTTHIDPSQAMAGDLVFFGIPAYHVGLYIGGGMMIHAPHTGAYVSISSTAGASAYGRP